MEHYDIDHVLEELDEFNEKLQVILKMVRESGNENAMEELRIALENIIAARNSLDESY
jgi:uncharacterized membrane protein